MRACAVGEVFARHLFRACPGVLLRCGVAELAMWKLSQYLCKSYNSGCVVAVLAGEAALCM